MKSIGVGQDCNVHDKHDLNLMNPIQAQWYDLGGQEHCLDGEGCLLFALWLFCPNGIHKIMPVETKNGIFFF